MATKMKSKPKTETLKGLRYKLDCGDNVVLQARGWMIYRDQFLNSSLWQSEYEDEFYFSLGYDSDFYATAYQGPKPMVGSKELAWWIMDRPADSKPFFCSNLEELPENFDLTADMIQLGEMNNRLQFDFMSTYISRRDDTADYEVEVACLSGGQYHDHFSVSARYRGPELEDRVACAMFANKLFDKARRKKRRAA